MGARRDDGVSGNPWLLYLPVGGNIPDAGLKFTVKGGGRGVAPFNEGFEGNKRKTAGDCACMQEEVTGFYYYNSKTFKFFANYCFRVPKADLAFARPSRSPDSVSFRHFASRGQREIDSKRGFFNWDFKYFRY